MAVRKSHPTLSGHAIPPRLSWTMREEIVSGPNPRTGVFEHFPTLEQRLAVYEHHARATGERLGLNECCRPFAWYEARGLDRYKLPEPGPEYPPGVRSEMVFLLEGGHLDTSERRYAEGWIQRQHDLLALQESARTGITSLRARRTRSATRE